MEYQSSINTCEVISDMAELGALCFVTYTKHRNKHPMISLVWELKVDLTKTENGMIARDLRG